MAEVRHIFRWDLDKTYLRSEFDSVRELVRTARLSAEERENIPGSAALLRHLRKDAQHGQENLIYFISGSPQQLRTVLEKKFAIDGFAPDGFVLKPAVSMFFRGQFRAIRSQVPYKLGALLRGRAEAPIGSQETLLGDDAESDAFIYSLYADIIAGAVDEDLVRAVLLRSGAYPEQIDYIDHELQAIVHEQAVRRIVIHLDQLTPPAAFADYAPRVVPIYNHLQTALLLYLDGVVGPSAVREVVRELVADFGFDAARLTNAAEDILRRQRLHVEPERLDALAADLARLANEISADGSDEERKADVTTDEALRQISERAVYLRSRPLPPPSPAGREPLDYLALFEKEELRRDEARRAKKLAHRQRT